VSERVSERFSERVSERVSERDIDGKKMEVVGEVR